MKTNDQILVGGLYHHFKGGRKAKIVLTGATTDGTPIVGYVHEGEIWNNKWMAAHNPEYKQANQPYENYNYFIFLGSNDCWWAVPFYADKNLDGKLRDRTILYVRTIANFTEDLGNGIKRFWLAE